MAKTEPKSPEQELLEAQKAAERATKEFATKKQEADVASELASAFFEANKAFEEAVRKLKLPPEQGLILASAIHSNVRRHLLTKCGKQQDDSVEEMQRIDELHNAVHELSQMGVRLERRTVEHGVKQEDGSTLGGPISGKFKADVGDLSKGR